MENAAIKFPILLKTIGDLVGFRYPCCVPSKLQENAPERSADEVDAVRCRNTKDCWFELY